MILIGQYDSSFVRRVGIALRLYGIPFEHRPWSVFSDAEKIREFNPLTRVPTLVLDSGEVLIESGSIIDHMDSLVPPERAMFPRQEPARRQALKLAALATGLAEKAVSLFYEQQLHEKASDLWIARCRAQILGTIAALEADRASRKENPFWFGDRITHADIAVACALRHAVDSHPGLIPMADFPALSAHCATLEAMPVFGEISQPFIPPA
ncbi:MAG TPA: glutathione S-transferase family protein [Mesorhizobium sp.]|jgi:glutathione S-transferase|nr:glutathione S-transferase family protein [Mesorhizobium sp.]